MPYTPDWLTVLLPSFHVHSFVEGLQLPQVVKPAKGSGGIVAVSPKEPEIAAAVYSTHGGVIAASQGRLMPQAFPGCRTRRTG